MAQMQDTRQMAASGQRTSFSTIANMLGAAISLALLVGVGIWGYKLLMRDVSGVPVVRAAEGPMRVQPENPGGQQAQHQGLSVNNVAAEGAAAEPADRLVLAPAPLDLSAEDEVVAIRAESRPATIDPDLAAVASDTSQDTEEGLQLAALEALAAQLADGVEPLSAEETQVAALAEPRTEQAPVVEQVAANRTEIKGGLKRSLRPQLRPAALTGASPSATQSSAPQTLDVAPDAIPVGTRLAQLGAYDSAEVARSEWDRLNARFSEYLEGKNRVIQKAMSGGRTFYRLRAMGFEDLSDARRFCSALVAEKAECIPVVTR